MKTKIKTLVKEHKISELLAMASMPRKQQYDTTKRNVNDTIQKGTLLKSTSPMKKEKSFNTLAAMYKKYKQ